MQIHCIGYFNFTKNAKKGSFFYYYLAVRIIFSNFALSIIVLFLQKIDFYLQKLIYLIAKIDSFIVDTHLPYRNYDFYL